MSFAPETIGTPIRPGRVRAVCARLEGISRPGLAMLGWGLVVGAVTALVLVAITPHAWPIQSSRATELRDSLAVLNHGGPLLLGHRPSGQLYAVGVTDDQGVFVYVPWLAHVLGVSDPLSLYRYGYVLLFALTATIYPLIFWRLTGSVVAGALAPAFLVLCARSLGFTDFYWIVAWESLTLLPLVYLLAYVRPRSWALIAASLALALAAGWVSSLRSQAGLGVLVAVAVVVLMRRWRWWRVIPVLAVLALAYWATSSEITTAVRAHRDARIHTTALSRDQPTGHPFWHTAYIGLGYLPNRQSLRYLDQDAMAYVQSRTPGTRFLSARYSHILETAYFSALTHHPFAFLRQYGAKVLVTTADAVLYLLLVAVTLPWLLVASPGRRNPRLLIGLTLPALVVTYVPPILAIPMQVYEEGFYGTLGVLGILGLTWLIRQLALSEPVGAGALSSLLALDGARRALKISAMAVALLLPVTVGAHFVRREAESWQGINSGVLIDSVPPAGLMSRSAS